MLFTVVLPLVVPASTTATLGWAPPSVHATAKVKLPLTPPAGPPAMVLLMTSEPGAAVALVALAAQLAGVQTALARVTDAVLVMLAGGTSATRAVMA